MARLSILSGVEKCVVAGESPVIISTFPRKNEKADGALARSISETAARESWEIEELHTEEGHLDDVFRNITLGDKAAAARKETAQ